MAALSRSNSSYFKLNILLIILLILFIFQSVFAEPQQKPSSKSTQIESLTVFVDVPLGQRKRGSAKKLTESHQKYAEKGYRLIDVEIYNENGDIEGFFVSYSKYNH